MFRKPHGFCCRGLLQLLSSPSPSPPSCHARSWQAIHENHRHYATAQGFPDHELSWPSASPFTPYDVVKLDRRAPYSQSRFYELVKIYHPDRPCNEHPVCRDISPQVRLQRYHMVIAAHEILSDPTKRAAYDLSGAGWSLHHPPAPTPTPSWAQTGSSDYGPIFNNATWEDWERWHNRHQGKQQHMVDNRTFTTFVILLAMLGGVVQVSWFGQLTTSYEDRLREVNEESSRFLKGRRETTANSNVSSEKKVQHFLIRRDPSGFGLKDEEQPVYQKILHPPAPGSADETNLDHPEGKH
ncbi:hypothetical protein FE257_005010 [Aspergillus nanangensis]|uniref:J domain-containing protein n=1 Tax=Aspergillus nanangensis TaxID=2582783 RepID=A0AAD4CQY9_ASPNN|nr:hypothetical protein FE257_005010 [Aspergillus nanangensis]